MIEQSFILPHFLFVLYIILSSVYINMWNDILYGIELNSSNITRMFLQILTPYMALIGMGYATEYLL